MTLAGRTHRLSTALTAALLLTLASPTAHASHYRFDQVALVTAAEQRALSLAGIVDTRELLHWTASKRRRTWLAGTTAIDYARLTTLATQCDLLRIDGVGPTIMEALQKASIVDTTDLARATPLPLLERLRVVTRGTPMRSRLPDVDTLASWIRVANRLRPVLEDLPLPAGD